MSPLSPLSPHSTSKVEERGKSYTSCLALSTPSNNGKNPMVDLFKTPTANTPKFDAYKKFNDFFESNSDSKKKDIILDLSLIKKKSGGNGFGNSSNLVNMTSNFNYSTQDEYKNTSHSILNKSREQPSSNINYSSNLSRSNLMGGSVNSAITTGNSSTINSKLRKEIESFRLVNTNKCFNLFPKTFYIFSKSLNDNSNKNPTSFINRPLVSLNKPDLQMNSKNYLEFSPTQNRKSSLVHGGMMRNYSFNNIGSNRTSDINNSAKYQSYFVSKLSNGISIKDSSNNFIQSYNHKSKPEQKLNILSRPSTFSNSLINDKKDKTNILLNFDSSDRKSVKTQTKQTESIEDFCKDWEIKPKKSSYIDKFSPKKKTSTEA